MSHQADGGTKRLRILSMAIAFAVIIAAGVTISVIAPDSTALQERHKEANIIMPPLEMEHAVQADEDLSYDISMRDKGYMLVEAEDDGYCLEISCGKTKSTYMDLPIKTSVIPLTMGDGDYHMVLAEKLYENKYEVQADVTFDVNVGDELLHYQMPNYMVNYSADSEFIETAVDLSEEDTYRSVKGICKWVHHNIKYDRERNKDTSGEQDLSDNMPDLDKVFRQKKGICIDQAAMTTAMLRSIGIPARLVFGHYGEEYHAWSEAYVDGGWVLADGNRGKVGSSAKYHPEKYY